MRCRARARWRSCPVTRYSSTSAISISGWPSTPSRSPAGPERQRRRPPTARMAPPRAAGRRPVPDATRPPPAGGVRAVQLVAPLEVAQRGPARELHVRAQVAVRLLRRRDRSDDVVRHRARALIRVRAPAPRRPPPATCRRHFQEREGRSGIVTDRRCTGPCRVQRAGSCRARRMSPAARGRAGSCGSD